MEISWEMDMLSEMTKGGGRGRAGGSGAWKVQKALATGTNPNQKIAGKLVIFITCSYKY